MFSMTNRLTRLVAALLMLFPLIAFSLLTTLFTAPVIAQEESPHVRAELLRVLELQLDVAESLGRSNLAATLEKTIEDVQFASDAELEPIVNTIGEIRKYGDSLERLDSSIQKAIETGKDRVLETSSIIGTTGVAPVTLTSPEYFDGGILGMHCRLPDATKGVRTDTEAVLNAKIALGTAKTLWAAAEIACGLDIVQVGSVGTGFAVCIGLTTSVTAAEEILDAFLRCDATIDEAHLDATFKRAEDNFRLGTHLHDNLDTHDTDIKTLLSEIAGNQKEIIKLLKTPQGNRPGWNKEGY